jgi:hypothetical protein
LFFPAEEAGFYPVLDAEWVLNVWAQNQKQLRSIEPANGVCYAASPSEWITMMIRVKEAKRITQCFAG